MPRTSLPEPENKVLPLYDARAHSRFGKVRDAVSYTKLTNLRRFFVHSGAALSSGHREQRLHQRALGVGESLEDGEMVGAVDRQQMAGQLALDPGLRVVDRLAA